VQNSLLKINNLNNNSMKLNTKLLKQFQNSDSILLAVTKYWNAEETKNIEKQLEENYSDIFF